MTGLEHTTGDAQALDAAAADLFGELGQHGRASPDRVFAFQTAWNAIAVQIGMRELAPSSVYDTRTKRALRMFLAWAQLHDALHAGARRRAERTTGQEGGAPPSLHDAAQALLAELARAPFAPRRSIVRTFQGAYNRSGLPIVTTTPALKMDGWYGEKTAGALQETILQRAIGAQAPPVVVGALFAVGGFDLLKVVADVAKFPITAPITLVTNPKKALHDVEQGVKAAEPVLSLVQGVVSMVPGIGTGVSAAIGAATALLDGGGLLGVAIKAAYGAIPIPDGMRQITDPIVDAVIALANHKSLTDTLIYVARERVPGGLPRDVFDTLIHVVLHKKPAQKDAPATAAHYTTHYTQGPGVALTRGLEGHPAAAALEKLPSPRVDYLPAHHPLAPAGKPPPSIVLRPAAPPVRGPIALPPAA